MPGRTRRSLAFRATKVESQRAITRVLCDRYPEIPAALAKKLARKGFVRQSGRALGADEAPRAGETIEVALPEEVRLIRPNPGVSVPMVASAPEFLVVEKAAGLVSDVGRGHALDTLLNGLAVSHGEAMEALGPWCDYGLVHRLDRDTSGLLLWAATPRAYRRLRAQFEAGTVTRRYQALVLGVMRADAAVITRPLGERRVRGHTQLALSGRAVKRAETHVRVVERFAGATLLEVEAVTGRWRQLRVHLALEGHPLAGDFETGPMLAEAGLDRASPRDDEHRVWCANLGLSRLFLHAGVLGFEDPGESARRHTIHSALPGDLAAAIARLRA